MESGRRHGWFVAEALSDNPAVGPRPSEAFAGKEGEAGHATCLLGPPARRGIVDAAPRRPEGDNN